MLVVVSVAFWIDGEAKRQWVLHLIFMLDTVFNVHIFLLVSDKQIAGLTNNSYLAESHEVRHCIQKYQPLGEYVLDVAKVPIEGSLLIAWHHFEIFSCLLYFCFMVITMVDLCKSCRSGWIICCIASLGLLRSRPEGAYPFWDVKRHRLLEAVFLRSMGMRTPHGGSSEYTLR